MRIRSFFVRREKKLEVWGGYMQCKKKEKNAGRVSPVHEREVICSSKRIIGRCVVYVL